MKCVLIAKNPLKLICRIDTAYSFIVEFSEKHNTDIISLRYRYRDRKPEIIYRGEFPQEWILPIRDSKIKGALIPERLTPEQAKKLLLKELSFKRYKLSEKLLRKQIKQLAVAVGKEKGIDVKAILRKQNMEKREWTNEEMINLFA